MLVFSLSPEIFPESKGVCMCMYMCISACVCIFGGYICIYECIAYVCVCMCIGVCICASLHVFMCVCVPVVCMCVHMCMCVSPENLFRPALLFRFQLNGHFHKEVSPPYPGLCWLLLLPQFHSHLALTTVCFVYFCLFLAGKLPEDRACISPIHC